MSELVLSERHGDVVLLTLNRPEARNAMNSALSTAFVEAFGAAQDAAAIVIAGNGKAWCAGLDLKELGSAGFGGIADFIGTVGRSQVPVIGAVNGAAVTGGLEMALQCDFLIGSELATFADTHGRVGVYPGGGMTYLLPQRVGVAFAREMSLTGNFVDAPTALRVGLINHLVPQDELVPFALRLAQDMASLAPGMLQTVRAGINEATEGTLGTGRDVERRRSREHSQGVRPEDIESRRQGILNRSQEQRGAREA